MNDRKTESDSEHKELVSLSFISYIFFSPSSIWHCVTVAIARCSSPSKPFNNNLCSAIFYMHVVLLNQIRIFSVIHVMAIAFGRVCARFRIEFIWTKQASEDPSMRTMGRESCLCKRKNQLRGQQHSPIVHE